MSEIKTLRPYINGQYVPVSYTHLLRVKTNRPSWRPIFCRIHTDEGIYGDGEAAMAYDTGAPAAYAMIKDLAPMILSLIHI